MKRVVLGIVLAMVAGGPGLAHDRPPVPETTDLDGVAKVVGWDFESDVTVEKVSDRLHVIFGIGGNVAVSVGEDGVLLVDDQFPQMVPKIQAAIGKLGGADVRFVINTHWHFDHADGNQTLGPAGASIVAHANSRAMMLDDRLIDLGILAYEQKAYPRKALPIITYDETMQLYVNGERIDLMHFGSAHTTGDTAVFFRASNAVHLGDVFVMTGYPFVDFGNGGSLDGVIGFAKATLARIDAKTVVIPGHGPLADAEDLAAYVATLEAIREQLVAKIRQGVSLGDVLTSDVAAKWGEQSLISRDVFLRDAYLSLTHRPLP